MQYLGFPDVLATPRAFEGFLSGLSAAGAVAGVPVQLCMPLPGDVLASVALPGVSNIRASDDDDLEYAERWRIGLTLMLFGALDVHTFMDSVWTRSAPPPYKYAQNVTELGVAISALSTGPLGLGDGLGATNATLVAAAVAKNGVILKPSLPAVPVDAYFNRGPGGGAAPGGARGAVGYALLYRRSAAPPPAKRPRPVFGRPRQPPRAAARDPSRLSCSHRVPALERACGGRARRVDACTAAWGPHAVAGAVRRGGLRCAAVGAGLFGDGIALRAGRPRAVLRDARLEWRPAHCDGRGTPARRPLRAAQL